MRGLSPPQTPPHALRKASLPKPIRIGLKGAYRLNGHVSASSKMRCHSPYFSWCRPLPSRCCICKNWRMWHTVRKNWQKPVVKPTTEHEGEQYVFIIEQGFQGSGHSKIDTIRSHKFRAFKCRQRRTRTIKIDPAELFRVFPKTTPNEQNHNRT